MKAKHYTSILIPALLTAVLPTLSRAEQNQKDVVVIATDDYYPPYHEVNEKGELVGYEVDLAKSICEKANIKCKFEIQSFSTLISSIRFNKHDIIMAGIGNNADRRRVIDFSVPYLNEPNFIAINGDNAQTNGFCQSCPEKLDLAKPEQNKQYVAELVKTFKGKTVGFERNSIGHRYFEMTPELKKHIKFHLAESAEELTTKLGANEIDAAFGITEEVLEKHQNDSKSLKFQKPEIHGSYFGYGVSIGIRKNNKVLNDKLNAAINELIEDGTIKQLSMKWFKKDLTP